MRYSNQVTVGERDWVASNGYRFGEKDPMLYYVISKIREGRVTLKYLANKSGVSETTMRSWISGKTRRPQRLTMEFVLRELGYTMAVIPMERD